MNKDKLVEIKKGEVGTGLLIEHDAGFISNQIGNNQKLFEDINSGQHDEFFCPKPFIVSAVFQKFGLENANGRIYPEHVLKREVAKYQQAIKERNAIGECNHPSESVIDLSRTAINIIELHWEGNTLVGQLEVLISEGFRRYGLITCQGDQVANLLLSGIKIGVSSRGLGSVQNKMGVLYVDDDFEIVCWDVVSSPSTNGAYISMKGKEDLQQYIENKDVGSDNLLSEKIEKFKEWLE